MPTAIPMPIDGREEVARRGQAIGMSARHLPGTHPTRAAKRQMDELAAFVVARRSWIVGVAAELVGIRRAP
ncbi:MAG: hypothetical protein WEC14_03000 [Chloroflexota bacterium]